MKLFAPISILLFLAAGCADGLNWKGQSIPEGAEQNAAAPCVLAVTDVNLIPMSENIVIPNQTVRFGKSEILGVSDSAAGFQSCIRTVRGAGKFLMPGLNDLHTHIESGSFLAGFGLDPEPLPFDQLLTPYLANGVTGLRIMSGSPDILAYRERRHDSDFLLHLVIASPMLSGVPPILPEPITRVVDTEEAARKAVHDYAVAGYDLIKIRRNLKMPVFRAVIEEAHVVGLHVDGHITREASSLSELLNAGQKGFAHLDEFAIRLSEELTVNELTGMLAECDCYISTTIGVSHNIVEQIRNYDRLVGREESKYVYPVFRDAFWLKPNNPYLREGAPAVFFEGLSKKASSMIKPLYDGGVPIIAGSDALNPMIVPGLSLLDELDLLVDAGLSPYEALRTSTVIPADVVPGFEYSGVLEKGRLPNAILLSENPLDDLTALRSPEAVILNGNFLARKELENRMQKLAEAIEAKALN